MSSALSTAATQPHARSRRSLRRKAGETGLIIALAVGAVAGLDWMASHHPDPMTKMYLQAASIFITSTLVALGAYRFRQP
jgi:ferric-dicitrate binding protein FerR (iron transport regulator)